MHTFFFYSINSSINKKQKTKKKTKRTNIGIERKKSKILGAEVKRRGGICIVLNENDFNDVGEEERVDAAGDGDDDNTDIDDDGTPGRIRRDKKLTNYKKYRRRKSIWDYFKQRNTSTNDCGDSGGMCLRNRRHQANDLSGSEGEG